MSFIKKYWPKEEIEKAIEKLSHNYKILSKKDLLILNKKGLICHPSHIRGRFGSMTKIFKKYNIKYPKFTREEQIRKMQNLNTKWNKTNILESLKKLYEKYGYIRPINLPRYSKQKLICHPDIIRKHFKTIANAYKEIGITDEGHYWTNARILKTLKKLYDEEGKFAKTHINVKFLKEKKLCTAKLIRDRFGSLEEAAKQAGIEFEQITPPGRIGTFEKDLLDKIETIKGIKLFRQYQVGNRFIDGYDKYNNIAYEIDEPGHKNRQVEDFIREREIKDKLGCDFMRIKLYQEV